MPATYGSPASVAPPTPLRRAKRSPRDTHAITEDGSRVIIHDVELFAEMESGPLGKVDAEKLAKIADETNRRIAQMQFPQLVRRHRMGENDQVDDASLGRVPGRVRVEKSPASGRLAIFGDLEVDRDTFRAMIASNRFPRRSAEIHVESMWMSQVSLIGRDRPRAPVGDTVFHADTAASVDVAADVTEVHFAEKPTMTREEILAAVGALPEADRKAIIADATAQFGEAVTPNDPEREALFADLKRRADEQAGQITTLTLELDKERKARRMEAHRATLVHMAEVDGIKLDIDDELKMLATFADDDAATAYIERIKKNYARTMTPVGVVNGSRQTQAVAANQKRQDGQAEFGEADLRRINDLASRKQSRPGNTGDWAACFAEACKELGYDADKYPMLAGLT